MLEFRIEDQRLKRTDNSAAISDNVEFLTFSASFDGRWENLTKTFLFKNLTEGEARCVFGVEAGKEYPVPHEVLLKNTTVSVSVFGVGEGSTFAVANPVNFFVSPAGLITEYRESVVPSPDLFSQIVKKLNDALRELPGKKLCLKREDGGIWWKCEDDAEWNLLISINEIKGAKGEKGDKGDTGATGPQGPKGEDGKDGAVVYLDSSVYPGYDLTERFSDEIDHFGGDPWAWIKGRVQAGDLSGINPKDYIPVIVNGKRNDACVLGVNTYKNAGPSSAVIGDHVDFMLRYLWVEKRGINKVNWNNGLIPVENGISYDNELAIQLTKPMASVASVKIKPSDSTDFRDAAGWTYDATSKVITLTNELSVSGVANVTGSGSEFPWLASDAYHWLNGLGGNVAADTTAPPNTAISYVDYGSGENNPASLLPQSLISVITPKKLRLFKRYSDSSLLPVDNAALDFVDLGAFWLPTELEVFGTVLGETNAAVTNRTSVQYPFFANSMEQRVRYWYNAQGDLVRSRWWLLNQHQGSATKWSMILDEGAGVANNASLGFGLPVCFRVAKT